MRVHWVDDEPTLLVDTRKLWGNWQRSQRDHNIHRPAVDDYKRKIRDGEKINPIIFEKFVDEDGQTRIRTSDGRHRLVAVYEMQTAGELDDSTVAVLRNPIAEQYKEIFD